MQTRREMLARIVRDEPDLASVYALLGSVDFLKKLVKSRKAITAVAKEAHSF